MIEQVNARDKVANGAFSGMVRESSARKASSYTGERLLAPSMVRGRTCSVDEGGTAAERRERREQREFTEMLWFAAGTVVILLLIGGLSIVRSQRQLSRSQRPQQQREAFTAGASEKSASKASTQGEGWEQRRG